MKSIGQFFKAANRRIKKSLYIRYRMDHAMPVLTYLKCKDSDILYCQKYDMVSYPPLYIEEHVNKNPFITKSEQYVCELKNVKILGSSNIVYAKRDLILYDLLCVNNSNYRITDIGFVRYKGSPIKAGGRYLSHYLSPYCHVETAINMVCNYSCNYYHFIMELIAKFFLLTKCDIPDNIPIIVDENVKEIPQLSEILYLFAGKRKINFLKYNQICEVDRLFHFSFVNHIIPNYVDDQKICYQDNLFCPEAIYYIRKQFLSYATNTNEEKNYPKRIFIARRNKKNRRYNEDVLIEIASKFGFEVISPEDYSAKEQFRLFSIVDVIIAPSGAALTNLVCCKPSCKVLVLYSQKLDLSIFSSIAGCLNFDLRYLVGKSHDITSLQSSFTIDEKSFKDSIINWLTNNKI